MSVSDSDRSGKYINLLQIHEWWNWETEHYNSVLALYACSAYAGRLDQADLVVGCEASHPVKEKQAGYQTRENGQVNLRGNDMKAGQTTEGLKNAGGSNATAKFRDLSKYHALRDSATRFSTSGFFHESVSPKPLSIPLGPFPRILGDICSSRCTVDTGGKFATCINNTSGTGGKFNAGVVDTVGVP